MNKNSFLQKALLLGIAVIVFCLAESCSAAIHERLPNVFSAGLANRYDCSITSANRNMGFSITAFNRIESVFPDATKMAFILGWLGTVSYIVAYLLLSLSKIKSDRVLYHLLNILGAIGLMVNAAHLNDYPNLFINIVWAIIALMAIFLIWRKRHVP